LGAAQTALERLRDKVRDLPDEGEVNPNLREQFIALLNNDLNLPQALAFALASGANKATWLEFDKVLGLGLLDVRRLTVEIPADIQALANERETARQNQDWPRADQLRQEIEAKGWTIKDTEDGPKLKPNLSTG
jgi:cysteinyl-tRNA synthetase